MYLSRRSAGAVAGVSYLVMGAMLYFTVLPSANGLWPPDFHLRGYNAASIAEFERVISDEGRGAYETILRFWDRIFIVAFALWLALVGWRGSWVRFAVVFLALLYAGIDLAENAAILRFMGAGTPDPAAVAAASSLTMAKFASLYLCVLVLIVHLRRTV